MIHLVLTLCRKFETSFAKLIDGGKGGECAPEAYCRRRCCCCECGGAGAALGCRAGWPPPLRPTPPPPPSPNSGGELILTVFEKRLPDAIEKQPFRKLLEVRSLL